MENGARTTERPRRRFARGLYDWVGTLIVSMLVLVVLFTFVFRIVGVDGTSMENTLQHGDQLLLMTADNTYERGDIVVIDRYTVEPIVKRVIAVGGDTIFISETGDVILNGDVLHEPYAEGVTLPKDMHGAVTVPMGSVFVLGDNRYVSLDSRSQEIGVVSEKDIIGKAVWRIAPFGSFGSVMPTSNTMRGEGLENTTEKKKNGALSTCFEWASMLIGALVAATLVFSLLFRVVAVDGVSMCDTLQHGDRLLLITQLYKIERGDIVVIEEETHGPLIKRVIAIEGDTVAIDAETGEVILNGELLQEAYVRGGYTPPFALDAPYTVPTGQVFVMGDNRPDSLDSRRLGAFSTTDVLGEVAYRLYPFSSMGTI